MRAGLFLPDQIYDALEKLGVIHKLSVRQMAEKILRTALGLREPTPRPTAVWPPVTEKRSKQ